MNLPDAQLWDFFILLGNGGMAICFIELTEL